MTRLTQISILLIILGFLIGFHGTAYKNYYTNKMAISNYKDITFCLSNSTDTLFKRDVNEYKDHYIIESDSTIINKSNIVWIRLGKRLNDKN